MSDFLSGITEKYAPPLLKGRLDIEGNVISCLFTDILLLDESNLDNNSFITNDGRFFYLMLKNLREKGFYSLDDVTIRSNMNEEVIERYDNLGGWESIQHQIDIINNKNYEVYLDLLFRENIILNMYNDGFNIINQIDIDGKKITPLKMFRKMTSEEVTDWYESRISSYGTGYSSKILEEEELEFDDKFISDCEEGIENGVPFDTAGLDINLDNINCLPFLSNQIMGLLHGTFSMIGGFSSTGKSSLYVTILMALMYRDEKILVITNEEDVKKFKSKFLVWTLGKYLRYFDITKKKLLSGNISKENKDKIKQVQEYWNENYKGKIKVISIADADMGVVKKKIRENVLRYGYTTILYDTFKMQLENMSGERTDLSLIRDSRELHKLAKKYNLIMLASVQLSEATRGQLFLSSANTSNSKQLKEILENYFLMRNVYDEEIDPKNRLYCNPFQLKKINDKWIEEPYVCDRTAVWRMLFVEKARNGKNSPDTGIAYMLKFDGDHCIFREVCQCRPKHGTI